ncbi:hypothetical protein MG7_04014, partial [Candida albicans P34048]
MHLFKRIALTLWLIISSTLAVVITEDRVDRGSISVNLGEVTVNSGASWSIINNAVTAFAGKINVQSGGGLYISSTSPLLALQVTLTSLLDSITNDGVISLDSRASLTASNYNLIGLSFTNNGEMYLAASGVLPSTMDLTAASWTNNGLLVAYQNQRSSGVLNLGTPLGAITNNGQICLYNQVYQQQTRIEGSGCITANKNSAIYISNAVLPVATTQNFYLQDSKSSMIVQAVSSTQTFNVYGFGNGNKIGITLPAVGIPPNPAYSYDVDTGILTVRAGLLSQKFNIGLGYYSLFFSVVTDNGAGLPSTILGSISYSGPVPSRNLPASCKIACKPVPTAPGTNPTEYTTTITTTNSAGNPLTETGVVDISTDSNGSWFTTTSIFPTTSQSSSSETVASSSQPDSSSTEPSAFPSSTGDSSAEPSITSDYSSSELSVVPSSASESASESSAEPSSASESASESGSESVASETSASESASEQSSTSESVSSESASSDSSSEPSSASESSVEPSSASESVVPSSATETSVSESASESSAEPSSASESVASESAVSETSASESAAPSSASETSVSESAASSSASESFASESSVESSAVPSSASEFSTSESVASETPASETPASETPASESASEQSSTSESSAEISSASESSAEPSSAKSAISESASEFSAAPSSASQSSASQSSTNESSSQQSSAESSSTGTSSVSASAATSEYT